MNIWRNNGKGRGSSIIRESFNHILNLVRLVQVNDKNSDDPSFCFYRIYSNKPPTSNQRPPQISAHPKGRKM